MFISLIVPEKNLKILLVPGEKFFENPRLLVWSPWKKYLKIQVYKTDSPPKKIL